MLRGMAPIALPGQSPPNASFEVPLEMLAACHQRIARQCDTLGRLLPHLAAHGADRQAQQAAQAVLRYFDQAAVDHHADEEHDLFPALRESMAGSDAVCLRELIDVLTQQHRALEAHWRALRRALLPVAAGESAKVDAALVERMVAAYAEHTSLEERELLPLAGRLLSDEALDSLGQAMRRRRGIALPD